MTKQELIQMYLDFLQGEGYRPEKSPENMDVEWVLFKSEGKAYLILLDKDMGFFRLVFPNFWSIDNDAERQKAFIAADYANNQTKVAKVHTQANNVWASIKMFCSSPEQFKGYFHG